MKDQILKILEQNGVVSHKRKYPVSTGFLNEDLSAETLYEEVEETNEQLADLIQQELVGDCACECHFQMPYGFVPEADCPIHDK